MNWNWSTWRVWGPHGSWRRKLTPLLLAALTGVGFAFWLPDNPNWIDTLKALPAVMVIVFIGCPITFGPLVRPERKP